MSVFDIFSKRQKRLRGESPDVYQYDELPRSLRTQVVHILRDVFGTGTYHRTLEEYFQYIHKLLAREYGVFQLHPEGQSAQEIVFNFLLTTDVEKALDVIEVSLLVARAEPVDFQSNLDAAVDELTVRFREHGIGYQIEGYKVVRVDSDFLHQEAVKPALHVLRAKHFSGAEEEFQKAHEHYRHQRYKETINESLKALESTLKVICTRHQWVFKETDTANTLIQIIFENGLIPDYLKSQFAGLRSVLESGVPTIRNRESGHGSGATPRHVPAYLASYVLHLTAAAIFFLAKAEQQL